MNHISSKRLGIIRWLLIIYSLHFLVGYIIDSLRVHNWRSMQAYTLELAALVAVQILYEIIASFTLLKKRRIWFASLISLGFALIETTIIVQSTGIYNSPYVAGFLGLIFIAGAFGAYWPFGIDVIILVGYLLRLAGLFKNNFSETEHGLLVVCGGAVIATISYFVWRRFYDLPKDPKLSELNTMLKSRQQQSQIIIQSIGDGVIVFNVSGKITLINPAAAALTEWPMRDAMGIDARLVLKLSSEKGAPDPDADKAFSAVLDRKERFSKTLRLNGQKDKQTIISLVISPILLPPTNELVGGVAVFRDITTEHMEEQQRVDFISTASHEMRTPVAAIEGYLALALNEKVSTIDSKARDYLVKAHQSTEHLGKLFQDLLTSAKAEDGRLTSHPSVLEMGAFLDQLTEDLRFAAQKKNLAMEFVVGSNDVINASDKTAGGKIVRPLYYVHVDPDRLREVITNLFDNAVKYTDEGKITLGLTGDNDVVQLYVRDTGPGIPANDIPHLFQKFYRVDSSATRTVGGTGLGLFICGKIIELYKGRIWVESDLGNGSTFFINLPRLSTQRAEQLKTEQATPDPLAASAPTVSS